jgi:hypothetical protein
MLYRIRVKVHCFGVKLCVGVILSCVDKILSYLINLILILSYLGAYS